MLQASCADPALLTCSSAPPRAAQIQTRPDDLPDQLRRLPRQQSPGRRRSQARRRLGQLERGPVSTGPAQRLDDQRQDAQSADAVLGQDGLCRRSRQSAHQDGDARPPGYLKIPEINGRRSSVLSPGSGFQLRDQLEGQLLQGALLLAAPARPASGSRCRRAAATSASTSARPCGVRRICAERRSCGLTTRSTSFLSSSRATRLVIEAPEMALSWLSSLGVRPFRRR